MAEAKQVAINREFVVSGFMSGQAYRIAVRVDTAATRLIRLGLRDFETARKLEQELVDGMEALEGHTKVARKAIDKINRRRREGVPTSSVKQNFMVRSLVSAQAFRCAVAVDQIQRDISMLGLSASGDVAKTANNVQNTISQALEILDSITESVIKRTDRDRQRPAQQRKKPTPKQQPAEQASQKAEKATKTKSVTAEKKDLKPAPVKDAQKDSKQAGSNGRAKALKVVPTQKVAASDEKPKSKEAEPKAETTT